MAIAKKGLRKVVVGGETYYWKLNGPVLIFPVEGKFSQLSVDFGWDVTWYWQGIPHDKTTMQADETTMQYKMRSVTPKFVAAAISYARDQGWKQGNMKLDYKNDDFSLAE